MRYTLILSGGSGTRLWPLSRDALPKQLIPVLEGKSLLEESYTRLEGIVPTERRYVCGSERHREASVRLLPAMAEGRGGRYIGEPEGRDTLAALTLSMSLIEREDPGAIVGVFTADHVIRPREAFRAVLDRAYSLVEAEPRLLVTFGVKPDRAATGFGYLELGPVYGSGGEPEGSSRRTVAIHAEATQGGPDQLVPRRVARFREKPGAAEAAAYVAAGPDRFLWNSGMFLWTAARFLELVGRYEAGLLEAIRGIAREAEGPLFGETLAAVYPKLKRISVDYGVMEKASKDPDVEIAALPLGMEWRDVGSWPAFGELLARDESGNASSGMAVFEDCRGTLTVSDEEKHLVACLGCEDLVVIHTADATLVCPRSRAEELKKLHAAVSGIEGGRYR